MSNKQHRMTLEQRRTIAKALHQKCSEAGVGVDKYIKPAAHVKEVIAIVPQLFVGMSIDDARMIMENIRKEGLVGKCTSRKQSLKQSRSTADGISGVFHNVPIDSLQIDSGYQRDIERELPLLRRYGEEEFDADAIGTLLVGNRNDGSLWIIDGQRRWHILKAARQSHAPCIIVKSSGRAYEAQLFVTVNKKRKGLQSCSLFTAARAAGHEAYNAIANILDGYGLYVPHDTERAFPAIRGINHLEKAHAAGVLHDLCKVVASFESDEPRRRNKCVEVYVFGGLCELLARSLASYNSGNGAHYDLERVRLIISQNLEHLVEKTPPKGLSGASRYVSIALHLADKYNWRLSKEKKITLA